jgi:hypothetical protein
MISPETHKSNLREINHQAFYRTCMDDSIINHHKWHQTHIPQEVLSCHYFVKSDKCPGLQYHCKENIVMEKETSNYPDTSLRNEHQECHYATRFYVVSLVNHVPIYRVVMSVVFSFKVIQKTFIEELVAINPIEQSSESC